jgi:HK97 family phage portal protein
VNLFGFEIVRKAAIAPRNLSAVDDARQWSTIWDSGGSHHPQAFQCDVDCDPHTAQTNWAVFACQTLIAGDMGKMRIMLGEVGAETKVFTETTSAAFSPVLRKPNAFQIWPQFMRYWMLSKLAHGNTFALKHRDNRNVVTQLTIQNPWTTQTLIAPSGAVYYRLGADDLTGVPSDGDVVVPASEIIHDRMWCLFHPLVGLSPLFASSLAAAHGLEIQRNAATFFRNQSKPGGLLVTPKPITQELAQQYKDRFETSIAGGNRGRTAVLGNGLDYKVISENAVDSQLVEQLGLSAKMVCATYHVPPYKVHVGEMPSFQNAQILEQIYYNDCLQVQIQDVEVGLDDGLALPTGFQTRFNLDDLLRMDTATQMEVVAKGVERAIYAPDEARQRFDLPPVANGAGKSPMAQQQNYSLEALAKRDAKEDPFKTTSTAPPKPAPAANEPDVDPQAAAKAMLLELRAEIVKGFA